MLTWGSSRLDSAGVFCPQIGLEKDDGLVPVKYGDRAKPAITEMKRISKPGLRRFVAVPEIPSVLDGMGLAILSTSKGVMSGAEAKKARVGGELICTVA